MSFDEAKSRKSSSVVHDDCIGYIERTSADTKVDRRNTTIVRDIEHLSSSSFWASAPPLECKQVRCYAINPARDLGPRVMTAMMGYGRTIFTFRDQYWIWCPIIAPVCGGLVGTFTYDSLLLLGSESILNRPNAEARRLHVHAAHAEKRTPYPGLGLARDRDEGDIV
ncbi:uncharacterized protein STEHIDRAFT_157516 [Stereum hirsutum FP-91666 SS1]|uniref:uncharacterized protein n=1 Tax=Stereum hirsutum (strain FP-91666) TaxID=721885 RepID=UPI000444A5C0|nr:uncharacterized protein STEHIDRAFT_157516 [Stereum hirsutum FP-91666 SS1]EIM85990.1 hypothetical protein STEHIDRAFT_157516 [Stereum hirsutum FP-91666 SS1]